VLEYRPDGTLVQTVQVPQPSDAGDAGGITFDAHGVLWVYNGNSAPYLSSWDSEADIWTHQSCAGWSSFLCFPCQGIGTFWNFVFATDEGAYGDPNGLVRFDRRGISACVRFADGRNYSALAVGPDGAVYGRRADDESPPPPTVIDVFDPTTLGFIKSVTLSDRSLSIAAGAEGHLYGVAGQSILHYSADGTLLDTHQVITNGALYTLALSADGRFVVVSSDGEVVIADATFTPLNRLRILTGSWAYAAIVPPRCSGDCNSDGQVTVDEILKMVNIALGNTPVTACGAGDTNQDGVITVNEIITGVNNALNGCPGAGWSRSPTFGGGSRLRSIRRRWHSDLGT